MLRHELGDAAVLARASATTRASTRTARSRRAISPAPSRRSPGATSTRCSTAGSPRPGHPELEGRWEWDEERKVGTLRARPEAGDHARGAAVQVLGAASASRSTAASATSASASSEATHAFEFQLPARPTQVIFDPGDVVLKTIRLEKNRGRCGGASSRRRGWASIACAAARALGRAPRPGRHRGARRRRCGGDAFWGVRAAAARALGQTRRDDARDALVARDRRRAPARAARRGRRRSASSGATRRRARALADRAARRRRQLLRRGRGGAGARAHAHAAGADAAAVAARPAVVPGRASAAAPSRGSARPATSARSRSCAMPGGAGVPWVSPARDRRGDGRAGARHRRSRRAAREFIEARLRRSRLPRARRGGGGAGAARHRSRRSPRIARRAGRRARRPRPPAHGTRPSAISRPARAPSEEIRQLHDEVERLRGETAKLRERLDRLAGPGAPPPRRPRPSPRPEGQAPPPRHPPHARLAPRPPLDRPRATRSRGLLEGRGRRAESPAVQLGDDLARRSRGRAAARRAGSRSRRRPGGRRRRSARRSC